MIGQPIAPSGGVFRNKIEKMMLLKRATYRVFSAIEIAIVFLVITVLLGCALFDTMLLCKPTHRAREIAEV